MLRINEATSFVSKHMSAKDEESDVTENRVYDFETLAPINES